FRYHIDLFENIDCILPVPLSIRRLLFRKYNQSALIGRVFSKHIKTAMLTDVLKRKRFTSTQGNLSFEKRHENVKDAFVVLKPEKIVGKTVLLVDDVMASGATILSCARVLKKSGAAEVRILTIARSL
ncbi:MAG: ComF family protein, partial [Alphaproteobacteria bacterium]|nr:ComF family protein [Alphaproteobacteria bacterium]